MPGTIRSARVATCLLVLMASVPLTAAVADSDDNPNIVLVLMDNFGWGEIDVYGGGEMRGAPTPRIDSIAAEGLRLTNYQEDPGAPDP